MEKFGQADKLCENTRMNILLIVMFKSKELFFRADNVLMEGIVRNEKLTPYWSIRLSRPTNIHK
jgi:hypothetical protein